MRLAAYAGTSMVLAAGVIIRALHERANFYSATVYLAQSNACLMILSNVIFLALGSVLVGLQRLLYGPLRPIEVEQLYERAWISLTETCLAMTIFRDEVGFWFIVMFVSLLVGKVWGWISEGRVDILEQQPPANPRLFHARLSSSLALSFLFDSFMLYYTVSTVRQQAKPNMMVMFAFEFAVLTTISLSTCARYALSLREAAVVQQQTAKKLEEQRQRILTERAEADREARENHEEGPTFPPIEDEVNELEIDVPGWEEKGRWVFYLNIVTDFLKLVLYMTFFCVLCIFYGMPIHIIRDVAYTLQSFYRRINDFVKYRHATRDMNERYPDATAEQIGREDTCIICREVMREWQPEAQPPMEERLRPKRLPCGHVLHLACLRSWLERQQNCPTCRQNVLEESPPRAGLNRGRNAPAQDGENRGGRDNAPPDNRAGQDQDRARIRYLNLGPMRLGFAAGNPQAIQRGLQADGERQRNQQQGPAQNNLFRQLLGGDNAAHQQQQQNRSNNITAQLQSIERQLVDERNINTLQMEQLRIVREMQGQLAQLRIRQSETERGESNPTGLPPLPASAYSPAVPSVPSGPTMPSRQAYSARRQQMLGSGHPDLPPGVAIPEGWHLVPLEPLPNPNNLMQSPHVPLPVSAPMTAGPFSGTNGAAMSPRSQVSLSPQPSVPSLSSGTVARDEGPPIGGQSNIEPNPETVATSIASTDVPSQNYGQSFAPGPTQHRPSSPSIPQWGPSTSSTSATEPTSSSLPEGGNNGEVRDKGKGRAPTVEDDSDEDFDH